MSNDTPEPVAKKATVLQLPPLGNPVKLGELYNQRTGQFLGVQLYPDEDMNIADIDIKHTNLTLSLSTTLEDKASLLEIDAHISLKILGGLINISGSASYAKEVRSNTREQAYALALKMRLSERRILFAEKEMGRNVLDIAARDYVRTDSATHFVSSIVYGGNIIINLVARQYKFSGKEKIGGSLGWAVDKIKGAVKLSASSVDLGDELKGLNDKFDLTVHGDVALERVPTTPQEVLEALPTAVSLITKDGGVPISVILQPIPEALIKGINLVYEIDQVLIEEVQKAFALLDDLRSRFAVLIDSVKSFEELIPELARVARIVAENFAGEHGALLHDLRDFLNDYQQGKPLPPVFGGGRNDDGTYYDIPVLKSATELYQRHLKFDDPTHQPSQYYTSTLVGLEEEFYKVWNFVFDIQLLRETVLPLVESRKASVSLSSIDNVLKTMKLRKRTPIFIMTSFTPKQPGQPVAERLLPDLAIIQFIRIIRENYRYFNDPSTPACLLYAETRDILTYRLPNLGEYSGRENPFFVISQVDSKGQLSWSDPPETTVFSLKLSHESSAGKRGEMAHAVPAVDGRLPFSVQVWAKASTSSSPNDSIICLLRCTPSEAPFLKFTMQPIGSRIERVRGEGVILSRKDPAPGAEFVVTFVQDFEVEDGPKWILYLNEEEVGYAYFTDTGELLPESAKVELVFPASNVTWWSGELYEVRAFSHALTKEGVAEEIQKGRSK